LVFLWPFGIICGQKVSFGVIWYIFPRFGMLRQEKSGNPASRLVEFHSEGKKVPQWSHCCDIRYTRCRDVITQTNIFWPGHSFGAFESNSWVIVNFLNCEKKYFPAFSLRDIDGS
jgi:hypothetical protein